MCRAALAGRLFLLYNGSIPKFPASPHRRAGKTQTLFWGETMKRKRHFWLNFASCFLIPCYTLLFAGSMQWFSSNFSVIAVTGADHYRGFVYWGFLAGGYFLVMLILLGGRLPQWQARLGVFLLTVCAILSLGYAIAIPYLPAYFPKYAALHVLLAALACVLLMAALLLCLLVFRRGDHRRWNPPLWAWLGIVAGSAILFLMAGIVSTALEVFFTISVTLLARDLWLRVQKDTP